MNVCPCGVRSRRSTRARAAAWCGFCSSVWSGNDQHATSVAERLRAGVTFCNNHNATAVDERAPFGGFDQSRVGGELGREGMLEFTETDVMSIPGG